MKIARRILVFSAIVLLLLALAGFLIWLSYPKAVELYQKAADRGNADAQNNLGWLYQNGEGVPMDLDRAAELFQKAADQGNADAQFHLTLLAFLYQNGGERVPKDVGKAAQLYKSSPTRETLRRKIISACATKMERGCRRM